MASLRKDPKESKEVYLSRLAKLRPDLEKCRLSEVTDLANIQAKLHVFELSQHAVYLSLNDPFWYQCREILRTSIITQMAGFNWKRKQYRFRIFIHPSNWKSETECGPKNTWEQPLCYLSGFQYIRNYSDFNRIYTRELGQSVKYFLRIAAKKLKSCGHLINVTIAIDQFQNE